MESYVSRQQVREINRKLFANDIIYSGEDKGTLEVLIANIIQRYDPEDSMAGVPSILELKESNLDNDTLEKILLLSTDSVIIQINNRLLGMPEKVAIIKKIKEHGYRIIIEINKEDEVFTLARIFADIIKFDIQEISSVPDTAFAVKTNFNCKKLAYNVDTPNYYAIAEAANIDYYEGTYISPSTEIEIQSDKHSQVNFIEVIALINNNATIKDLSNVIARDSLMSAQVIRLSNSVYYGALYRIESVENAIIRIGLDNLKRWIFLLQFSKNDNVPEELLQTSYHRAILSERLVKECKIKGIKETDAYLIGLFSTLDALTGRAMNSEISKLHVSEVVEDALIYRDGIGGTIINLIRAYEEANWHRVDKYIEQFKIKKEKMFKIYFESLDEVTKLWKSLTELGGVVR